VGPRVERSWVPVERFCLASRVVDRQAFDLMAFYDDYARVEEGFGAALEESLHPRGPQMLYDIVAGLGLGLGLGAGAKALDVGSGEGRQAVELAQRFGFEVRGVDPVPRHVAVARQHASSRLDVAGRVSFTLGGAEQLPVADGAVDLVWCRDVLVHVPALDPVYAEFRRVLAGGGRAVIYQMFATDLLEPAEAGRLFAAMGVFAENADPTRTVRAVAAAGLHVDDCIELGSEWGEYAQEHGDQAVRRLLHTARLLRQPDRYIERFGREAYDIAVGDCLWHVYRMIGKLGPRVYLLSVP